MRIKEIIITAGFVFMLSLGACVFVVALYTSESSSWLEYMKKIWWACIPLTVFGTYILTEATKALSEMEVQQ